MTSSYPAAIDSWSDKADDVDALMAIDINDLHAWIVAVQTALGVNPQGGNTDLAARLQALTPE